MRRASFQIIAWTLVITCMMLPSLTPTLATAPQATKDVAPARFTSVVQPTYAWAATELLQVLSIYEYSATQASQASAPEATQSPLTGDVKRRLEIKAATALQLLRLRQQKFATPSWTLPSIATVDHDAKYVKAKPKDLMSAFLAAQNLGQPNLAFWASLYQAPTPTCQVDAPTVQGVVSKQAELMRNGATPTLTAMQALLRPFTLAQVQCLTLSMHATGAETLPTLMTIKQSSNKDFAGWQTDSTLTLSLVLRLTEKEQFADALSALLPAIDREPHLRLTYDLLQRIYNYRQKGAGAVAIQTP